MDTLNNDNGPLASSHKRLEKLVKERDQVDRNSENLELVFREKSEKSLESLPHYDNDDDDTWVTSHEKRLKQLVKERDELDGKRGDLDIYRESLAHDDDDETWVTSPAKRLEQLAKERNKLDKNSDIRDDDTTWVTNPQNRHQQLQRHNLKAGLTCELCHVNTFDNNLMEQHLMGRSHLSNVEKQLKCKWDKQFKNEMIFRNEMEKASNHVELNNCSREKLLNDEIGALVIHTTEKGDNLKMAEVEIKNNSKDRKIYPKSDAIINDELVAPVIENTEKGDKLKVVEVEMNTNSKDSKIYPESDAIINDEIVAPVIENTEKGDKLKVVEVEINNNSKARKIDFERDTIMAEAQKKKDVKCDTIMIETAKEQDIKNDPLHEAIKVPNETVNKIINADCDVCKIFLGGDGEVQRHQIPAHACIGEDIGFLALPDGWTEMVSRTSGVTYYVNNITKERQWVRPINPVIFPEGTDSNELPEGWVEKKSKSKGCPYYVNKITNQRQWERPIKAPQVEKLAETGSGATETGTVLTKLKENPTSKN